MMAVSYIVTLLADEAGSVQTVSRFTWNFDQTVAMFHQGLLENGGGGIYFSMASAYGCDGLTAVSAYSYSWPMTFLMMGCVGYSPSHATRIRVKPRETVCFMNSIGDGLNDGTSG